MDDKIAFARELRKAMTPQEIKVWLRLRALRSDGIHFRRQAPIDGYVLDFVSKKHKVIVEVDGSQHGSDQQRAYDVSRDAHFRAKGYRIVRLWNNEVNSDPDAAAETVLAVLNGQDPYS